MVCIEVFNKSTGKPLSNVRVAVEFTALTRIGQKSGYTDSNGRAYLSTDPASNGIVYIKGSTKHRGRIEANMKFFI
jgi:uncharacterized protein YfaS (alpha-2-macroglobulin family)